MQIAGCIFEIVVVNTLVEYWGYDLSPAILISGITTHPSTCGPCLQGCTAGIVLYLVLNIYRADLFGEAECELHEPFVWICTKSALVWLSLGKVLLAVGLMFYTFITMVGGNPLHE